MSQLAVARPLRESDLRDQLRTHPVRALARQAVRGERRRGLLERGKLVVQRAQQLAVEAGADRAGVPQRAGLVVADEQRAESLSAAARLGEPADHEFLLVHALQLQPRARSLPFVRRGRVLRDQPYPALPARLVEVPLAEGLTT